MRDNVDLIADDILRPRSRWRLAARTDSEVAEQAADERRRAFMDPFGYRRVVGDKVDGVSKDELAGPSDTF